MTRDLHCKIRLANQLSHTQWNGAPGPLLLTDTDCSVTAVLVTVRTPETRLKPLKDRDRDKLSNPYPPLQI